MRKWGAKMSVRRKFTEQEKRIVYERYNGRCVICGKPVSFKRMTIDHKVPLSAGGTNQIENLQLACLSCNQMKGRMNMEEFWESVRHVYRRYRWLKVKLFLLKLISS